MAGFSSKKTNVSATYRNEKGQVIKLIQVKGKSAYEIGSRSHQGYILEVDGEKVAYVGDSRIGEEWSGMSKVSGSESSGNLISYAKDNYGDNAILMSESDFKAFEEGRKAEEDMKREIQKSQIAGAEALEKTGELQKLETSKAASETAKMLETALLAGGMTPEEVGTVTSKVVEDTGSIGAKLGAGTEAAKAGLSSQLTGLNLGAVKTGADVEAGAKQLAATIDLSKQQMKSQERIAELQKGGGLGSFLGDLVGSAGKTIVGDLAGKFIGAGASTPSSGYSALLKFLGL
tara:strand:- start:228 stop:1094 length:867 start_codon:yes stop_codon:yes gene_type:complete